MGVAHDLANLLAALTFRLYPLETDAVAMRRQGENIRAIARIVANGKRMVGRLQELGARDEPTILPVDLAETVASSVELALSVRPSARRGRAVRIRQELGGLPPVASDPDELRRVFLNLVLNARDAMPAGGTIAIRGRAEPLAVVVTVEDEGTGIPATALPRIFDPLFTTKGAAGTGMGLAVVRGVMRRFGGAITARNRPGGGACFELRFRPFRAPTREANA